MQIPLDRPRIGEPTNRVVAGPARLVKVLAFVALVATAASCGGHRLSGPDDASTDGGGSGQGGGPGQGPFLVGGSVMGLAGSGLVLQNNAADDLTITGNGTFMFGARLASGAAFDVTVKTQPMAPKQSCVVTGSKGLVARGNVTTVVVNCATDTFTVGGTVSGLAGAGLVLQNNAGDPIPVNANGAFAFPVALADGSGYSVTIRAQPTNPRQTCTVTSGSGRLAGANADSVRVDCVMDRFTVGGTVVGLAGTGLTLQDNAGDDLPINADGRFAFLTPLDDLSPFEVTIKTQPLGPAQTCTVTGGAGTIAGSNATSVVVNCATNTYAIGGTISGLAGSGLVLQNSGGDGLAVGANGTFAFATPLADGASYDVRVMAQPTSPSQTCTVTSGTGRVSQGAVSNIRVICTTNTYAVGGTLSGLASGESVVLENSGGDDLALSADGAFTFPTPVASGATYLATVRTNPSAPISQTCTVTSGSGIVTDVDVATISVVCVTNRYTIGGTVSGLLGAGLVLRNNGVEDLLVTANGAFTFAASLESGADYRVSILTQPSGPAQTCVVTGGAGTVASGNVVSVAVNCVTDTFTVGGTVSGLDGVGLVLQNNGGDDLAINANGTFAFATPLVDLSDYQVTVRTQPTSRSQTCTVSNGSGTAAGANVTNVAVNCVTSTFTISGTVSGLGAGESAVLQNNGGNNLTVANGAFRFTTLIASGSTYAVTVFTKPADRGCTVTNGSGTVVASNVTNVTVNCITICVPNCSGRNCGPDGCGGSCGICGPGQACNSSGVCICVPNCTGCECGSDGCGGSCGTCPVGKDCDGSGTCVSRCVPNCTGKTCGPDGCGGSCGACGSGQECSSNGTCVPTCVPSCAGLACGPDGCGGSCGSCGSGTCVGGFCCPTTDQGCRRPQDICCQVDFCGNCIECIGPNTQCR